MKSRIGSLLLQNYCKQNLRGKEKKKERRNGPEENRKRREEKRKNDIDTERKETRTGRINSLL